MGEIARPFFILDGVDISDNPPTNWRSAQIKASFDASSVQANIETENFEFTNLSAQMIKDYIAGGVGNNTNGIFEGLGFQIGIDNGTDDLNVFDGFTDFETYEQINPKGIL